MREIARHFEIPGVDLLREELDERVERIRSLKLELKSGVFPSDGTLKRVAKHLVGGRTKLSYYRCKLTPNLKHLIWKDPLACFCAGELASRHGIPVLFCVRNPWAVAASFKRMHWGDAFDNLAQRLPALHADLPPEDYDALNASPVEKAGILWHAVYRSALEWTDALNNVYLLDIQSLIERPLETHEQIYARLGLDFSAKTARRIEKLHGKTPGPAVPAERKAHVRRRDLAKANDYWQTLLTGPEIDYVSRLNGALWQDVQARAAAQWAPSGNGR